MSASPIAYVPVPETADGFRALARSRLHGEPDQSPGHERWLRPSDFDLNPEAIAELTGGASLVAASSMPPLKPAAVLIPAIARREISLLFTRRTDHLAAHAGQIAFPGGKMEPTDAGPLATALREAREEIGLDPALVEPLGFLDSYRTGTGFRITPVVALVDPVFTLSLDPNEVADAFEVPLPFLMDVANHQQHVRAIGGKDRRFHAIEFGERFIWGATAGILRNMHERLFCS